VQARELAPQRCPCLKEGADHYLEHGVTVSKLAHTRFKAPAAKARHLIENTFCRLKDFRRITTRYDRLAINFAATIYLVGSVVWWIL
jgi:transposase